MTWLAAAWVLGFFALVAAWTMEDAMLPPFPVRPTEIVRVREAEWLGRQNDANRARVLAEARETARRILGDVIIKMELAGKRRALVQVARIRGFK